MSALQEEERRFPFPEIARDSPAMERFFLKIPFFSRLTSRLEKNAVNVVQ